MRICILTQPLQTNYGGLLQAYALQTVLKRMGHMTITVNQLRYLPMSVQYLSQYVKNIIKKIIGYHAPYSVDPKKNIQILLQKSSDLQHFINTRIDKIDINQKLTRNFCQTNTFDAYIVGSDQVWRPTFSPNIYNYFLDFTAHADVKRIAYAASFGVDNWEFSARQTRKTFRLVQKFNAVSVREQSGIMLCKRYFNIDAAQLLDPTMLLSADDYRMLYGTVYAEQQTVAYILDMSEQKQNIVNRVCNMTQLPQLRIGCVNDTYQSIEQWLASIDKANFVVTDSFHGTVFSILFHKPFISIANSGRGIARFQSLLDLFGLGDRLVNDPSDEDINRLVNQPIDYERVELCLNEQRNNAIKFLSNI